MLKIVEGQEFSGNEVKLRQNVSKDAWMEMLKKFKGIRWFQSICIGEDYAL